jgi:pimeloyl-ACP methyl ester carboxylesterase
MADGPAARDFEEVEFPSEGAVLRGRLYAPRDAVTAPVVVMAHGFSATISMTADRYAETFADAGLCVLLYDHRGFGASSGEPRQEINPWIQARGYRDAVTFAVSLPGVDGGLVALWGDSFSGAVVLVVAAIDDRVAAVVAQVPATGREMCPDDPDGDLYRALRDTLLNGDVRGGPDDRLGPLPVVSADQIHAPSLLQPIQAYRWFVEYGGRFGTGWENRATRVIPQTAAPFHAAIAAPYVGCPVLMQISPDDEMVGANPAVARSVYDAIRGPKQLLEIDGGHFGLLHHPSRWFDEASTAQREFLVRVLRPYDHSQTPT